MCEELSANAESLTISFVEVPRDSYARNGILQADRSVKRQTHWPQLKRKPSYAGRLLSQW